MLERFIQTIHTDDAGFEALAETEAQLALSGVPSEANGGSRKRGRLADDAGA